MVKSAKKSATKVNDAPAVTPSSKSTKKAGKREAEESIEKLVSAKKQKINEVVKQAVPVKKPETKAQKKKKVDSSSDDSSSEEEVKVVAKKAVKPVVESSSEESSSDEEAPKATVAVKQTPAKKGKVDSDSESSSGDDSDDEVPDTKAAVPSKKQPAGLKNGSVKAPAKKGKAESSSSDSDSDESDDESEEDEKPSAKAATQVKKQVGAKNGSVVAPATKSKAESSSDSSSEDDSSSDEEDVLPKAAIPKTIPQVAGSKKTESSDSSDDSDSDEEKPKPPSKITQQNKMVIDKDESDDGSDDESEDESEDEQPQSKKTIVTSKKESSSDEESSDDSSDDEGKTVKKNAKVTVSKKSSSESSSEESSDEEEESDDEKSLKTPKKNGTDVEMVDASHTAKKTADLKSVKKDHQTPVPAQAQSTGQKTLFVGNLSFKVERSDVENFFKDAGEVVDVRFSMDQDGNFKGFGHVEFATADAALKALKLHGKSFMGREVRLDLARERGERAPYTPGTPYTPNSGTYGVEGPKVFVRGFDTSGGDEDQIRSSLEEAFKGCGEIAKIRIPTDRDTGSFKGMAFVEFTDKDGVNKAMELDGSEFGDNYLTVQEAKPRDGGDRFSGGRGGRGFGGRDGGRGFGGRRGGRDSGGRRGGRDSGGRRGGRGRFDSRPSITHASTGKKTTFGDD